MRFAALLIAFYISGISGAFATQVQEITTPGGFKAWLVEERGLPLVAVKIAFRGSGIAYDPAELLGRTSMMTAMLTEGAGDLDSKAFNEALEEHAIDLHFAADEDMVRASLLTLSEHTDQAFAYLGMALTKPRLDDNAFERVRRQTLLLLQQQEKEPGYQLSRQWELTAFPGHPYSNPALGTEEGITSLTPARLRDYQKRYFTRANIVIAVVGDITPEKLATLLDTHLAGLSQAYTPDAVVPETRLPEPSAQVVVKNAIPQTMVVFGAPGLKRDAPDYYAGYVLNHIIGGGGLSAMLIQEIREKRGLAYSVGSQLQPLERTGLWIGQFATRNDKAGEALAVLRQTLARIAAQGVSDQELQDAKTYLTGSFVLGLDSNADIANYLIGMQLYHLGADYLDKRNAIIASVTREQVRQVAAKLLDPKHLLVVMVGDPVLTKDAQP